MNKNNVESEDSNLPDVDVSSVWVPKSCERPQGPPEAIHEVDKLKVGDIYVVEGPVEDSGMEIKVCELPRKVEDPPIEMSRENWKMRVKMRYAKSWDTNRGPDEGWKDEDIYLSDYGVIPYGSKKVWNNRYLVPLKEKR